MTLATAPQESQPGHDLVNVPDSQPGHAKSGAFKNGRGILAGGFGYDEESHLVPVQDFEIVTPYPEGERREELAEERRLTLWRMVDRLVRDGGKPAAIGARVLRLAFLLQHPSVPSTQRGLAKLLGVTEGAVSKSLATDDWETSNSSSKARKPRASRSNS